MEEFKIIFRLLAAIRLSEEKPVFDCALIDKKVLQADESLRDRLALKLLRAGYIEGLCIVDGVDNAPGARIMWGASRPEVTLKGLEYLSENAMMKKALREIKETGISVAAQTLAAVIDKMA